MVKKILSLFFIGLLPLALYAQLSGSYTINPGLPASATNYQSFSAAIAALNAPLGISAPVTFTVSAATYTGQYTLNSVVGASSINRIVFVKAVGVNRPLLTFAPTSNANNYILRLDDADYLTLDGLDFATNTPAYNGCIDFARYADYTVAKTNNDITIQNCLFTAAMVATGLSPIKTNNDAIMGQNVYDWSLPQLSNNTRISNLLISNNTFSGFYTAIALNGEVGDPAVATGPINGYNNISIVENTIRSVANFYTENKILFFGVNSGLIRGNTISSTIFFDNSSLNGGAAIDISSRFGTNGTITVHSNTVSFSGQFGIHISYFNATNFNVYNNLISGGFGDQDMPQGAGLNLSSINEGIINIFNNTIRLYAFQLNSHAMYGFSTTPTPFNTGVLNFHNNIITAEGDGACVILGIFNGQSTPGFGMPAPVFNNNDYYSSLIGGGAAGAGVSWLGNNYSTIAALSSATGMDTQSISADPLFMPSSSVISCSSPCLNAGTNAQVLPAATTDILGNPRIQGAAVDMGAYEKANVQAIITKSNDLSCSATTATLTATATSGNIYLWSNGGTTNSIAVTTAASYTVTITNTNTAYCASTATASTVVSNIGGTFSPTIAVTGASCPKTLTTSGGGTYLWSMGATTAAITAASAGTYTVTVTNPTGCTGTAKVVVDCCNLQITEMRSLIYVHAQAVTFPTPTVTGCAVGSVLTYFWEFGDGTTSTLASPTRTYTTTGVYNVCLTVTCTAANGSFCRVKCCRDVNIGKNCPSLYPTFSFTTPATGLAYTFMGTIQSTSIVPAPISTYEIYNSATVLVTTLTGTNATYTFPNSGEYTVCRNLTSIADANYGAYCTNKNCRKLTVMPTTGCNAAAKFVATTYKANPLNVTFNASSYSTGATAYYWEYSTSPTGAFTQLGTAANSILGTPAFLFPSTGVYWVRLTVNKGTACETAIIARINLNGFTCTSSSSSNPNRTVNPDGSIEVGNSDINDGIGLYPNPTDSNVTITFGNDMKATTMVKVFDMKGTLIASFRTQEGDSQTVIDLSNQAAGMYLFHIENENGERLVKKVIKE